MEIERLRHEAEMAARQAEEAQVRRSRSVALTVGDILSNGYEFNAVPVKVADGPTEVAIRVFGRFRPCSRGRSHDLQVSKEHKFKILERRSVSIRSRGQRQLFHLDKIFPDQTDQQEMFEHNKTT